jgi:hypothetical protein
MAEELLDLSQILSYMVEEDRGRTVTQSVGGDLPHPECSAGERSRRLNARLENGAPK